MGGSMGGAAAAAAHSITARNLRLDVSTVVFLRAKQQQTKSDRVLSTEFEGAGSGGGSGDA